MNAEEIWNEYRRINNNINDEYESFAFGDNADLLADLVLKGEKTATSSAYELYESEDESLPESGRYDIILDSKNRAICIIQITNIYITEFDKITASHAFKEGEGDKSLAYWHKIHKEFFTKCLNEAGIKFNKNMKVVCEEFKVVFKI